MRYPAKALRSYREKKKLSQEQLAERLKAGRSTARLRVSRRLVGMWETGERAITAEWAVEIEKILGINRVLHRPDLFRKRMAA